MLVTGGAGFIGRHLVADLVAAGHPVTVLDDGSTGLPEQLRAEQPTVRIIHGSVTDPAVVAEALAGCRGVWHLAAAVGVQHIMQRRVAGIRTNVLGTETVLAAAAREGVPVLLASSSEVYGRGTRVPFAEDDERVLGAPTTHRWSYACAKALDEFLALAYHQEQHLPVRIVRFFNITGPGQRGDYGMVLPRFCAAARRDGDLVVHGDGRQTRCFCHVRDAVRAIRMLWECPGALGRVVNVGGAEEIAIADLARRVIARAGAGRVVTQPYAEAFPSGGFEDLRRRVPDLTRLRQLTDWTAHYAIDAIIDDCLAWAAH